MALLSLNGTGLVVDEVIVRKVACVKIGGSEKAGDHTNSWHWDLRTRQRIVHEL